MPEPLKVIKEKVKKRLKGKSPSEQLLEIDRILPDIHPVFKELIRQLEAKREILRKRQSTVSRGAPVFRMRKASPRMILIGAANAGKSTLLSVLTD